MARFHKIDFEGFSGYLNYLGNYAGYGGMQWNSMYEVQDAYLTQQGWCDTGYNNVLRGSGEGSTLGNGGFQSYDLARTFNLVQGVFASAWESNQPVIFNSYTYTQGQGFTLKASDTIYVGQDAKRIYFPNYGTDFKHIAAVSFVSGDGGPGNTCSYGHATYGYVFVMDNLIYKWNPLVAGHDYHPPRQHHNLPPAFAQHLNAMFAPAHPHDGTLHQPGGDHVQGHDPGAGLTPNFTLPQAEHHFGF